MNRLEHPSRRTFLQSIGATALATFPSLGAVGSNDRIRLGVIGCGGRGTSLMEQFRGLGDVSIVALADPDTEQMAKAVKAMKDPSFAPDRIQDYRKLLERDDIDGVIVASPNYWHALHTVHACQAGKDVYVEKPVTHQLGEARVMAAAAAKHGRIVQAGTQNRSDTGLIEAFEFIRGGAIGKITAVRGLCYRNRGSIGPRLSAPLAPPATIDYDLWLGPAQDVPIFRKHLHYDWHWVWNTGGGDNGNQAPHEYDLLAWVLGDPAPPAKVGSFGQRFGWNDAGETPNIQTSWFDYGGVPAIFEVNNLWVRPKTNAAVAFKGIRVGVVVTCEGGEFRGGRGGGFIVGPDGKETIRKFPGDAGGGHARNFIDAMRSRKADALRGQITRAGGSADVVHLSNLSYRTGRPIAAKELREQVLADSPALLEVLDRQEAQLAEWSIERGTAPYVIGHEVEYDAAAGKVVGKLADSPLAHPTHRTGYTLPELG